MLTRAIITLASQYGRYGYRRITALLKQAGLQVGKDRVERICRREGLKVPQVNSLSLHLVPKAPVTSGVARIVPLSLLECWLLGQDSNLQPFG